jgi:hypothetical protein
MGPRLRAYVEDQLLADLEHYGVTGHPLTIDWSDPTQEGHVTSYLDGRLEDMSDISVRDIKGSEVARGWIDFVHGSAEAPLFVFWLYLDVLRNGAWLRVKERPGLPLHIWEQLPDQSKNLCAVRETYDSRWSDDPLVVRWRETGDH